VHGVKRDWSMAKRFGAHGQGDSGDDQAAHGKLFHGRSDERCGRDQELNEERGWKQKRWKQARR